MPKPSKVFSGYRALGFVSNHVPLSVRYIENRKENLAVTAVGKSFHTYGCHKLTLLTVSDPHPDEIECIASDSYMVFTACKNLVYAWRRGNELKHVYKGHESNVHLLLPFGPHLLSVNEDSTLIIWDIKEETIFLEMNFSNSSFCITTMIHPSTYLNKILLGSKQGSLQLWNINTNILIYTFAGWKTPITVLEKAPAIDVVAIGLESGVIYIHNLRVDETIMKLTQEWGPVSSISFRTDGKHIMASGSPLGHIAFWNLDKKRLHSEMRHAHKGDVSGMEFLPNEPLLVTSSPDNTLKMWIFDMPDDGARLLKHREGHSDPPLKIRFHGSKGQNILSAGLDATLRSFSCVGDNLNRSFGQASYNRKTAKKKGPRNDPGKMPPIIDFASETTREKDWDSVAACHRGLSVVTTWNYDRGCMGEHKLLHERFKRDKSVSATCLTLTVCGNFVIIGYNTGHVDKFNIQSGLFRGTFGNEKAHDGFVRGVVTDELSQVVITGGSDKVLNFWKFKDGSLLDSCTLKYGISHMITERESAMIAVALDNFSVIIVDVDTRRIVRKFEHYGQITDMTFSPDSRWLIVACMDCTIKTWDLSSKRLLDCFLVSPPCVSLCMSPLGTFLATAHVGDLGIYLWSNATLYSFVSLQPLPSDYEPQWMDLPYFLDEKSSSANNEEEEEEEMKEETPEYKSPEQISNLITLCHTPHSDWKDLQNFDIIKMRNKPKEPPKVAKNAPFFLPIVSGLEPSFEIEDDSKKTKKRSRIQMMQQGSPFFNLLTKCEEDQSYDLFIEKLSIMSPSMINVEVKCLSPQNGGSITLMLSFMKAIVHGLKTRRNFDVVQACLGLFNQTHGEVIASEEELFNYLPELQAIQTECSEELQTILKRSLCMVNYFLSTV